MKNKTKQSKTKYYLNKQGEFVIENYNYSKPFANFFPGIAGKYGIPMWVFYVNRGQCISSFGTRDKDQAILEFFPANKSWQFVSSHGFRTFIKLNPDKENIFYEPFHNGYANLKYNIKNLMRIDSGKLTIEEENLTLGIKTTVEYFNIPNDTFAGLSRTVTIENNSKKIKSFEVADGLPQVVPFGTNNFFLKKLGRTIEAWMKIDNLENKIPFYRLEVDPSDRPEVVHIKEGNFYLGFDFKGKNSRIIKPIVDPEAVFGQVSDFSYPLSFLEGKKPAKQLTRSKTPSAFLALAFKLAPGENKKFYSVSGQARDSKILNDCAKKITEYGYIENKLKENTALLEELKSGIMTKSSSLEFDLYAGQTYLDNIMRGGYPQVFSHPHSKIPGGTPPEAGKSDMIFYLYSRKHGDLERDYNKFQLQPTYFSQGNGNYRDTNQNRRNDLWFNPLIKDENIIFFMNLIQADGFNPLVVKGESFKLKSGLDLSQELDGVVEKKDLEILGNFFKKSFSPGELILFLEDNKIKIKKDYDSFLDLILELSQKSQEAEHGEGFWTDHWTYNLDLIDSYLAMYPEAFNDLFFKKPLFTFYDNSEIVRPRVEKYILYGDKPRQLHSLVNDSAKKELISKRASNPHVARTQHGQGEILYTSLIAKLLCLAANKLASLDSSGVGIEMEANKPNWFDSLNGLPALFGSSSCETFELKRLFKLLIKAIEHAPVNEIELPEEIFDFIEGLSVLFNEDEFNYWDKSSTLKENYRHRVRLGFSGITAKISVSNLNKFLSAGIEKVQSGLNKAFDRKTGMFNSYFINEVLEFDIVKEHYIKPKKFSQKPAPLFLEGQMHAMRLSERPQDLDKLHQATKKSPLFDRSLKMYKVTESLEPMPEEIGRCRVFAPGWLENESIWLHMEYKYLLELLRGGLAEEFYAEFKNVLVPFQDPQRYGRSILENSSFIVSSAFEDKNLHGNGFVARLSGSTAEFLHIWLLMNVGPNPFSIDESGQLNLSFKPSLAGWLFDNNGIYKFNFLSSIAVNYYNPKRKNTFPSQDKDYVKIKKIDLYDNGKLIEIDSPIIPAPYAERIRSRQINQIDIFME